MKSLSAGDIKSRYQGMNSHLTSSVVLALTLLSSGCFSMPPTEVPLPGIETADSGARHDSLVIMLPGRGDRADTFIAEGFTMAGERWSFDTIAVDAHFGYYRKRILLPRLHEDIVVPARAAGYKNIWLLGISAGGFGSLLYAAEHPDEIDGVILLAPYLGDRKLAEEIDTTGGLAAWSGDASGFEDHEIAVWAWLQEATNGHSTTPVILGYGESDGSAKTHAILAKALKPSSVYTLEGGHKWTTWRPLWEKIAADLEL
jgi:pimeloyl-ACP methyl ester carboxylesterase